MNYFGRSRGTLLMLLIPALSWSQDRAMERKCCPGEPRTAGQTVYTPAALTDTSAALADLAVDMTTTTVTETRTEYRLHVRVLNDMGDDCASTCSKAIIMLPTETVLKEVKAKHHWKQCFGYVEIDLPMLCPKRPDSPACPPEGLVDPTTGKRYWYDHEFDVVVTRSTNAVGKCQPAFGVFVRGEVPDSSPQNNYWWWYRRCPSDGWDPGPAVWGPRP